ncbi:MAG: RDD family protein [Candidatus Hermodarchaeota archaeon]
MRKEEDFNQIDVYINEVSHFLPYPKSKKTEALEELRIDVQAAMKDSKGESPSTVFGNPRDVAKNVSQSHEWYNKRTSWVTRFFAWIIDLIIEIGLIIIILGVGFLIIIVSVIPFDELMRIFSGEEYYDLTFSAQNVLLLIFISILTIFTVIILIGYNAIFEYYFGATVGKKLLNLGVVDLSGIRITWKQAIIRNFSKVIISEEFLPIDVILGMILERFDPDKARNQRGLDILAETIVIKH